MHYVISDLHGRLDLLLAMLDKLRFSDEDVLYFLGDAADRGPDGIGVIRELRRRPNVFCLLGNHEDMFRRVALSQVQKKPRLLKLDALDPVYVNWTRRNGGDVTWKVYRRLPKEEQLDLLNWMVNLPTYLELSLGGVDFLLAHAGVGSYRPEKALSDCSLFDFIWERMDYDKVYYQNKLLVTGHTPTAFIDPAMRGRIVQKNNHIAIDCGAVYLGVLGCVCLETLKEFYVTEK